METNKAGKSELVDKIVHVSKKKDGAGYDILSFTAEGRSSSLRLKLLRGEENCLFTCPCRKSIP